jgi:putative membrane-bound dehydrogenase-like protein
VLLGLLACSRSSGPPYNPEEALKTLKIEDGFQIELFANEPDITDPVAMDIDESGRIYVLENHGYPLDTTSAEGKVKLLEDTNGDGRPDRTRVFADKLVMPTGVMAWKKGVLVTDPPNVLYFEDTNGDGAADVRKVVLAGFAFTNPQHTVSSPYYGLDNWIYLSHEGYTRAVVFTEKFGDPGKEIHFPDKPDGPRAEVTRRSVRFRPDTSQLELLAGPSQFGQTFDAWGHLFTHNNSNHAAHEVIAARYLERNPHLRIAVRGPGRFAGIVCLLVCLSTTAVEERELDRNVLHELRSGQDETYPAGLLANIC